VPDPRATFPAGATTARRRTDTATAAGAGETYARPRPRAGFRDGRRDRPLPHAPRRLGTGHFALDSNSLPQVDQLWVR
jgi:hypothetical protein